MKKFWIQVIALLVVGLGAMYLTFNISVLNSFFPDLMLTQPAPKAKHLTIGSTTIALEIADTQSTRSKGLSDRSSLDQNSGMLFVFTETKKYQFWMKGMNFPIDILWIKDNVVVDILKNVPAPAKGTPDQELPLYEPITPINQVLEVNAGFVDAHGIKVGDSITLEK